MTSYCAAFSLMALFNWFEQQCANKQRGKKMKQNATNFGLDKSKNTLPSPSHCKETFLSLTCCDARSLENRTKVPFTQLQTKLAVIHYKKLKDKTPALENMWLWLRTIWRRMKGAPQKRLCPCTTTSHSPANLRQNGIKQNFKSSINVFEWCMKIKYFKWKSPVGKPVNSKANSSSRMSV